MNEDEQARRERAQRLREEIAALRSGRPSHMPKSPREFVDEQARKQRAADADDDGNPPGRKETEG